MSVDNISETIQSMCKNAKSQIELMRILLKELSVKVSDLEGVMLELEHYAEEGFYGDADEPVHKCGRPN